MTAQFEPKGTRRSRDRAVSGRG